MTIKNTSNLVLLSTLTLIISCGQMPERLDCGTDSDLSIDQRIESCNETKTLSNGQKLNLIARKYVQPMPESSSSVENNQHFGEVQEFYKDPNTGLIWQTSINYQALSQQDAKKICDNKKALNLKWRLPTQTEYLTLGNYVKNGTLLSQNHQIDEIFEPSFDKKLIGKFSFWTSSSLGANKNKQALIINSVDTQPKNANHAESFLVQCVSDGTPQPEEKKKEDNNKKEPPKKK